MYVTIYFGSSQFRDQVIEAQISDLIVIDKKNIKYQIGFVVLNGKRVDPKELKSFKITMF